MKRLLFFICTLLCANVIMAQWFWEGDFEYYVTGAGEVEVYDCYYSVTSVNIPSSVTHTWKHYNFSCDCYITDSVRTYSVTSIGDYAFEDCYSLTSVNIPNSVTSIGDNAFSWRDSLTSVTIGNSVTSIGDDAFSGCSSLTSVDIPNSVTSIGYGAFYNCSSLTSVTLSNNITELPYDINGFGDGVFEGCSSLTSITIPNSVTSIGYDAFYGCSSLTTLNFNAINCEDFDYYGDFDYYDNPFYNCPITTINIGNSVQRIPAYFAYSLSSLTSVNIGNSVTSIGNSAFTGCSSLTSVTIPNSVTSIGKNAFAYCSSLTSVTIPNNVTSIGNGTFWNCSGLTSVNIPNSVTSIGDYAFESCSSLTSVTIPNSVTSIGSGVFYNCSSLTSVTLSNNITSLSAYYEYYEYYGFFEGCSSLTSIDIPNSVTSISEDAFKDCSSLTSVTCLATNPPALGESAFNYIGSPRTLYVPNGCRQAYENANWIWLFDCIVELGSNNSIANLDVEVNNEEWGSVEIYEGFCGTDTLTAVVEEDCSKFLHWNDGNTDNPRVVNVTSDTSFTAIFKDPVLDTTIDATIMQGETYNFNGQELSEEGVYNATVLSVLGCEINLTVNLDVIPNNYTNGETSSLQETELEEIVFYPNPTKGLISFSKTIEKIEVVDISGKILLSFSNVREINIGDLPAGSYLLRLHSNENSVLRKIVKE